MKFPQWLILAAVLIGLVFWLAGCTYVRTPEGAILIRFGYDTSLEGLVYRAGPTSQPTQIGVDKFNSQAKALDIAAEAVKRIPVTAP